MKKTLKTVAIALSFLIGTAIYSQTDVYAKGNQNKGNVKSEAVTVHISGKENKTVKEALPFGLLKKENTSIAYLPPVIKQGGILIPVKAITKSLGANLVWDNENQTVTITKEETTIVINLATKSATVNGTEVALQNDNTVNNGTLVPLKFIAENLGIELDKADEEQIIDDANASDTTQTVNDETTTQENTSTNNTDVQAPASTDAQTSTDNTVIVETQG